MVLPWEVHRESDTQRLRRGEGQGVEGGGQAGAPSRSTKGVP